MVLFLKNFILKCLLSNLKLCAIYLKKDVSKFNLFYFQQREREEAERKALEREAATKLLTPEEIREEKLRQEKLQRESDLKAALDTTFGGNLSEKTLPNIPFYLIIFFFSFINYFFKT